MNFLHFIAKGIVVAALGIAALFGYQTPVQPQNFGGTSSNSAVSAVFETSLAAPMGTADTSLTLATNAIDTAGDVLPNIYTCFTIDQGQPNNEFACGTVSGTSVTGLLRGVSPITGTTSVTALAQTHRRGADIKITDWPTLGVLNNQANGIETFPNLLQYSNLVVVAANSPTTTITTKDYVDKQVTSGCANAATATKGCVQMGTAVQNASTTVLGSTGANLAIASAQATSSPGNNASLNVVITQNDGKISPSFLNGSNENYTFNGTTTLATTTVIGSGASGGLVPPGSLMPYASTTAPAGWLIANGASVLRASYPLLFAVIGVSYGSADGTHFTLPNLSGRTILTASTTANIGQTGGESNHTQTTNELPSFTLHLTYGNGSGGNLVTGGANSPIANTAESNSIGGGAAFNVLDPYISMFYIIKY